MSCGDNPIFRRIEKMPTMDDPHDREDPATGYHFRPYESAKRMAEMRDQAIKDQEIKYPSPLGLYPVPWYLRLLGYSVWRFKTPLGGWHYLPNDEYWRLFNKDGK